MREVIVDFHVCFFEHFHEYALLLEVPTFEGSQPSACFAISGNSFFKSLKPVTITRPSQTGQFVFSFVRTSIDD